MEQRAIVRLGQVSTNPDHVSQRGQKNRSRSALRRGVIQRQRVSSEMPRSYSQALASYRRLEDSGRAGLPSIGRRLLPAGKVLARRCFVVPLEILGSQGEIDELALAERLGLTLDQMFFRCTASPPAG
jgi:hypothetical protein